MTKRKPTAKKPSPPKRMGPRPLMLHMNTAMLAYQSLRALWPNLANGQIPFQPELREKSQKLIEASANLDEAEKSALLQNLDQKILGNLSDFWDGVLRYQAHPYARKRTSAKTIWKSGKMRLLDYGAKTKDAPMVFIVPSLVNRYYILDLMPQRSFVAYLRTQGFRPLVLDWDSPQKRERRFTLDDYTKSMLQAFDAACKKYKGQKPVLAGYCMGGVFALAAAIHRPKNYAALLLIATPWDFKDTYADQPKIDFYLDRVLPQFQNQGLIPVDLIQSMFFDLDPMLVVRKFQKLGATGGNDKDLENFVALEDWINDGVPLSYPVMMQCMRDWYRDNVIGKNNLKILGKKLDPKSVRKPSFVLIPKNDRIVPPQSAKALATHIKSSRTVMADTGHIGLMASRYASTEIWPEIAKWLKTI